MEGGGRRYKEGEEEEKEKEKKESVLDGGRRGCVSVGVLWYGVVWRVLTVCVPKRGG